MALVGTTVEQRKDEILKLINDDKVRSVVLSGESGIGKTWTARGISDHAISNGLFDNIFWVFLNRKYDKGALYENIACHLSLLSTTEWEDGYDHNEEVKREEVKREEVSLEDLKHKISAMTAGKSCLLILDDEGNKMTDQSDIRLDLIGLLFPPNQLNLHSKVLITRIQSDSSGDIIDEQFREVKIKPLTREESLQLFQERAGISISKFPHFESQLEAIIKNSKGLPAAVVVIAEALRYVQEHDSGTWKLECALEEASNYSSETESVTHLMRIGYDMLPNGVITDCCWHCKQFFHGRGSVHYNEIITYWLLEGYLGPVDHIDKAYRVGHHALMELVKRGMLKRQEDNTVIMEGEILEVKDCRRRGFGGTAELGLANVLEDGKWEGLGEVTQVGGMIRTPCNGKNWQKLSTLLLDGNRLYREVGEIFSRRMDRLQVLALFNPRLKSLPLSLSSMVNLLVFVIRGGDLLENVDHIRGLKKLIVLEISGAGALEKIPDNLFEQTPNLQSINLSGALFSSLPSSLFQLSQLCWLILRGCSFLDRLPSLKAFVNLEVLDLSGATSLKTIQDRNFSAIKKLQTLDLSRTQVSKLPYLQALGELTRLLARDCSCLVRLPDLKGLSTLQILDLSGASMLKEIPDTSLENKNDVIILDLSGCSQLIKLPSTEAMKHLESIDLSDAVSLEKIKDKSFEHLKYLQLLNLSKTKVTELPSLSNLGNLRQLFLKHCPFLETLPKMEGLTRLEVLDLTGASSLREILYEHLNHTNLRKLLLPGCSSLVELPHMTALGKLEVLDLSGCSALKVIQEQDRSFEHMTRLSTLNLSETKIECLPSLSNFSNLSHLLLRDCTMLKELPPLGSLSKLVELDLCGASSLLELQAGFLEHMAVLQILNLSKTPLAVLPSMLNLVNLSQLLLGGCSNLKTVPNLEALTKLEVLDLSGTAVGHRCLESLNSLSNLHKLLLRGCSSLEVFPSCGSLSHLEVIDLFGTGIKEFPYWFSELTHLKCLDLPHMKNIQVDWGKIKWLPEEINWDECGIPDLGEIVPRTSKPSIIVSGIKFFEHLEKNSKLWDTCFKQFHFSVCFKGGGEYGDIYCHSDESIFKDIYSQARHLSYPKDHSRSLEIRGFSTLSDGIKQVIRRAEFVSLVENEFLINVLSDLGADNVKDMKGCWIERCTSVKSILCEGAKPVGLGRNLEILWVSNLTSLQCVQSGKMHSDSFKNLKRLYLDCCTALVNIFSSSQVPENLETLKIKFCSKLVNVFSSSVQVPEKLQTLEIKFCDNLETVIVQNTSAVCTFPKLQTLRLWELPELKSIGGVFPSLQAFDVRECPQLPDA